MNKNEDAENLKGIFFLQKKDTFLVLSLILIVFLVFRKNLEETYTRQ